MADTDDLTIFYGDFPKAWNFLRAVSTASSSASRDVRVAQQYFRDVSIATVMAQLDQRPEIRRSALSSLVSHLENAQTIRGIETVFISLLYNLRDDLESNFISGARATWSKFGVKDEGTFRPHLLFYNFETRTLVTPATDSIVALRRGAFLGDLGKLPSHIVGIARVENPFGFTSPILQLPAPVVPPVQPVPVTPVAAPVTAPVVTPPAPPVITPTPAPTPPARVIIDPGDRRPQGGRGIIRAVTFGAPNEVQLERQAEEAAARRQEIRDATENFQLKTWGAVGAIAGTFLGMAAAAPSIIGVVVAAGTGTFAIWLAFKEVEAAGRELNAVMAKQPTGTHTTQNIYIQNNGTVIINATDGTRIIVTNPNVAQPTPIPALPVASSGGGGGEDPDPSGDRSGDNEGGNIGGGFGGGFGGGIGGSGGTGGGTSSEPQSDGNESNPGGNNEGGDEEREGDNQGEGGTGGSEGGTIDGADGGDDFRSEISGGGRGGRRNEPERTESEDPEGES